MFAQPLVDTKARLRRPRGDAPVASAEFFAREATVTTLALTGLDCHLLHVTARLEDGPAAFDITGLPETRMRETRVRVRAGLAAARTEFPSARLSVRFDHPELVAGGSADLAIALAVLSVADRVDPDALAGIAVMGELTMNGALRGVRGMLPMLLGAAKLGLVRAIVPRESGAEAAHARAVDVRLAEHLLELVRHLREGVPLERPHAPPPAVSAPGTDLAEVHGLPGPRRALEVAAAGGHGVLMTGPEGSGRTMLARRLPGILPELTEEEAREVTSIYSVAGLTSGDRPFIVNRPFRAPHHTVSAAGVLGGGDSVRPGEVTLAHLGVLFLDDALEFRASLCESLALVLWDGHTTILRGRFRVRFPANALTVCATAPCPCGFLGFPARQCTCPPERLDAFRRRLSLPLFETLDVRFLLPARDVADIRSAPRGEPSAAVRERVSRARALARSRAHLTGTAALNAALTSADLERVATPDAEGERSLIRATDELGLSDAQVRRVRRVARTVADLEGSDAVRAPHVDEAVTLALSEDPRLAARRGEGDRAGA